MDALSVWAKTRYHVPIWFCRFGEHLKYYCHCTSLWSAQTTFQGNLGASPLRNVKPRPVLTAFVLPSNPPGEAEHFSGGWGSPPLAGDGSVVNYITLKALRRASGALDQWRLGKRHFCSGGRRLGGPSGVDRRHFVNTDLFTGGEVEDAGLARDQGTRKLLCQLLWGSSEAGLRLGVGAIQPDSVAGPGRGLQCPGPTFAHRLPWRRQRWWVRFR